MQKKKLSITDAVEQWAETSRAIEGLKMLQGEAAAVLIENAERTGKRTFKDRIAVIRSGGNLVLNQVAVRGELPAERFVEGDLMKRQKLGWSLKLLK